MNIHTQCCGLVILMVVLYFYCSQKKVNLNTGKSFWRIYLMAFVNIVLDISSIIAITFMEQLPLISVEIICKTFLTTFSLLTSACYTYIREDVYKDKRINASRMMVDLLVMGHIILVILLPINAYRDGKAIYTYGPAVVSSYVFSVLMLISTMFFAIRNKDKINTKRRNIIIVWVVSWICCGVIQFMRNELLLTGFISAVGVLIIFIRLENPELNIDKKTGFFTKEVFIKYVKQRLYSDEPIAIITLNCINDIKNKVSADTLNYIIYEVSEFINSKEKMTAFISQDDEIYIVIDRVDKADEYVDTINERFSQSWGENEDIHIKLNGIYIKNTSVFESLEDLMYVIEFNRTNTYSGVINVDEEYIEEVFKDKKMEKTILEAIRNNSVEVFYQPIYSTVSNRFVAAEALVRIRDEEGGLIFPGSFIEIAERTGLILGLGSRVFQNVCKFIKENDISKYGIDYIEVNLSVVQCSYEHLADNFIAIMKHYEVEPKYINLEITETATSNERQTLLNNMRKLMDFGVSFSLDDFGTGQSNLNYIVEMPVQIVKFDKSMIDSYFANGKAKYVMNAAMNMIHGMELPIVAEGIETVEQLDTMKRLNIEYIQGYYFSKPVPGNDFINFIVKSQQSG